MKSSLFDGILIFLIFRAGSVKLDRMRWFLLLVPVAVVVCGFGAFDAWENYHRNRAVAQLPTVISLLDKVQPFPGSKRTNDQHWEQASAHKWAAAVVWRHFVSDARCSDVQAHFEGQADTIGFLPHSNDSYNNNSARTFRDGEYEFRFVLGPRLQLGCDIAISTNWYGFQR